VYDENKREKAMIKPLIPIFAAVLLTACGGAVKNEFMSACEESANIAPKNCQCLAAAATKDLPEGGLVWLTTMILENEEQLQQLRTSLAPDQWKQLYSFMMSAPTSCGIDMDSDE